MSSFAARWLDMGRDVVMVTLTYPHHYSMPLDGLWRMVAARLRYLRSGDKRQRFTGTVGLIGSIRVVEVTVGWNGWDPHVHLLLFLSSPPEAADLAESVRFVCRWCGRWITDRQLGELHPIHVVDVRTCRTHADVLGSHIVNVRDGWTSAPSWSLGREDRRSLALDVV